MSLFDKPIALDPGPGGCCVGPDALRAADIIVSTTKAGISGAIRVGTSWPVSHAALFVDGNEVIEAIGEGVVRQDLATALSDDALAVVYRHPDMKPDIAQKIVRWAAGQIGKPYDTAGAVYSSDKIACRIAGPRPAGFFCSELVLEAYKKGGLRLTEMTSECVTRPTR
jgi:uncharacterized protein YycO